jgi:glycosyltransferase involved in cell wall biosynthesis
MRISVITVVKNDPRVAGAVGSVLGQKGVRVESIVADGASTDGTLAALQPFRRRIHLLRGADKGIYDAMNKGLARARGDVVGFLNADDLYQDDQVLADVARAFSEREVQVVFGDLVFVAAADPSRVERYWRSRPYRAHDFERGWMPAHPTFFARRSAFKRLGGFQPRYGLAADYELMLRFLAVHRLPSRHLARILVRMRSGGASTLSLVSHLRHNRAAWRAAKDHRIHVGPLAWFILRKAGGKLLQWVRRPAQASA